MRSLLSRGGLVSAWGSARNGRLGLGSSANRTEKWFEDYQFSPEQWSHPRSVVQVACGSAHSVALTENGEVWTCGLGSDGQLGHGDKGDQAKPKRLETLPPCKYVAAGSNHSLAISNEGFVFGFGSCRNGQLGLGKVEHSVSSPTMITAFQESGERMSKIFAGNSVSAAISEAGTLYTFGSKSYGLLGHGELPKWSILWPFGERSTSEMNPRLVDSLRGEAVAEVYFGLTHALALLRSGAVLGWGRSTFYSFANGKDENILVPKECEEISNLSVEKIAVGISHSVALTFDGNIFSWGVNENGVLGTGNPVASGRFPVAVEWFSNNRSSTGIIRDISAGMSFSVAATDNGVVTWGKSEQGQLGAGMPPRDRWVPDFCPSPNGSVLQADRVVSGSLHTLAIKA